MSIQGDTSFYSNAAPSVTGEPIDLTDNRFSALGEAGNNIQQNNANTLAFAQNDQQYALQRENVDFERDKFALGIELQNRTIDLNARTIDSQATATDAHSAALLAIQKKIDTLDESAPQYQRTLAALTNSFTAISSAGAQINANITTQTAQGHGSLQTAQSGALGATSVVSGQQIDAGIAVAGISADTQLGLADKKVILDTTLGSIQGNVANHHADVVGAPVAQGQGNYYTGIGSNTAGFTNGNNSNVNANYTGNGNYNLNYGLGGYGSPTSAPAPAPTKLTTPTTDILSGQIKGLMEEAAISSSANLAAPVA